MHQQVPDIQAQYGQMPSEQAQFGQMPSEQLQYGQMPSEQAQYGQMPAQEQFDMQMFQHMPEMQGIPVHFDQFEQQFAPPPQAEDVRPDDGSEECLEKQQTNPMHAGMSVLENGRVYCAQAADSRWWDVTIQHRNCDGSYAVKVKDDASTEWPVAQRAYFLDKPCNEFYREALKAEGLSEEEIRSTLESQGFTVEDHAEPEQQHAEPEQQHAEQEQQHAEQEQQDVEPQQQYAEPQQQYAEPQQQYAEPQQQYAEPQRQYAAPQQQHVDVPAQQQQQQQQQQYMQEVVHEQPAAEDQSRWPTKTKKKMPMKVVAAAAMAGAVPLFYGLSGSST